MSTPNLRLQSCGFGLAAVFVLSQVQGCGSSSSKVALEDAGGATPGRTDSATVHDSAGKCAPTTCADLGFQCGQNGDGCGGMLSCGACIGSQTCGGGGTPNVCGGALASDAGDGSSAEPIDSGHDASSHRIDGGEDAAATRADGGHDAARPTSDAGSIACTVTVSSVAAIDAALTPGAVVCLKAGTYGAVSLTAKPSSNATLTAAPGAHVVVAGVTISGSNLTVSQLHSTNTILLVPPATHDIIDHNDVTSSPGGYGIQVACNSVAQPGCSYITISGNQVHDLRSTVDNDGDALRLDGWANVTLTGNEVFHIEQQPGSDQGHTDCLQSYNAGVTTHDLVFEGNYIHDNQCEGPPFLKDGDVSTNVTITNNLSVRGANLNNDDTALFFDENTNNAIIRNNTYQDTNGSVLEAQGTTANPTANVDHNVFDVFNSGGSPSYNLIEDYNIFTGGNEWSFTLAAHDLPQGKYGTTYKPTFLCGSECGNGTVAGDDYRLATNPNGIGIDWAPASKVFGPTN